MKAEDRHQNVNYDDVEGHFEERGKVIRKRAGELELLMNINGRFEK